MIFLTHYVFAPLALVGIVFLLIQIAKDFNALAPIERAFKKLSITDLNLCEYCNGEGEYEQMHLRYDGEPEYWNQPCLCTVEDLEPKVNIIRVRESGAIQVQPGQLATVIGRMAF